MATSKPSPPPTQAFNDVLAKMMQAEVNEGGPPPATPCDTPVEVISQIHMKDPEQSPVVAEDAVQRVKAEFEKTLDEKLESLRREIHEAQSKSVTLTEAAKAKWHATMADLEAKHKFAREKLDAITRSTGKAWESLRDGASHAWKELEEAVKRARSEF